MRNLTPVGIAVLGFCSIFLTGCAGFMQASAEPGKMKPGAYWGDWPANADPHVAGKKVVVNLINRPVLEARQYGIIYPEVCTSYGSFRYVGAVKDKELMAKLVDRYDGMLTAGPPASLPATQPQARGGRGDQQAVANAAAGGPATAPTTQAGARGRRGGRGGGGGGRGGGGGNITGLTLAQANATSMIPRADHVDRSVFGTLPLEIYRQTRDARYLAIGKKSADDQWVTPDLTRMGEQERKVAEGALALGLTAQTRWWIDDMFMIPAVQVNAYRATKDMVYLDRAARSMAANLDKLQQPSGLFYHADDVPIYWGRGDGWVAAGMAELLLELPKSHPQRARIMEGYKKMMAALLKYQAPDGMWRQLLDKEQSWAETSCTGMFTFAMATGVRQGWLEPEYKPAVRKAWIALCSYLNEDGAVREVCIGTNKLNEGTPEEIVQYYLDRQRRVGDLHGQAAFIWAAWAMLD